MEQMVLKAGLGLCLGVEVLAVVVAAWLIFVKGAHYRYMAGVLLICAALWGAIMLASVEAYLLIKPKTVGVSVYKKRGSFQTGRSCGYFALV